jgi:hypothetical protein
MEKLHDGLRDLEDVLDVQHSPLLLGAPHEHGRNLKSRGLLGQGMRNSSPGLKEVGPTASMSMSLPNQGREVAFMKFTWFRTSTSGSIWSRNTTTSSLSLVRFTLSTCRPVMLVQGQSLQKLCMHPRDSTRGVCAFPPLP